MNREPSRLMSNRAALILREALSGGAQARSCWLCCTIATGMFSDEYSVETTGGLGAGVARGTYSIMSNHSGARSSHDV